MKRKHFLVGGLTQEEEDAGMLKDAKEAGLRFGDRAVNTFKQEGEAPAPVQKAVARDNTRSMPAAADAESLAPKFSTIASTGEIAGDVTAGVPSYGERAARELMGRDYVTKSDADMSKSLTKRPQKRRTRATIQDAGFKSGGKVSSASSRGDGIAQRGKTRGRYI